MKKKSLYIFLVVGILLGIGAILFYIQNSDTSNPTQHTQIVSETSPAPDPLKKETRVDKEILIGDNSSFYSTMKDNTLTPPLILKITDASKDVYDLSEIKPGTKLVLTWNHEVLEKLRVLISGKKELEVVYSPENSDWFASMIEHDVKIEMTAFFGNITSTLWDSAVSQNMPVELITELAEIFASQVDFTRELNVDDQWGLLVEKQLVGNQIVGYGNILLAELSRHEDVLSAYRFVKDDGRADYFDADGKSARGKFIKSPLKYSMITSRFQHARFHPILKVSRPHKGVDFSAPTGTPVRAVGDGVVLEAGRNKGSGIMLKIRHDSRYMTAYKHLSKIAHGVKRGSKVEQGQVIGYVGMTGLATGPHLHFEFYEDSKYVDPLGKRFPRKDSVDPKNKKRFQKEVKRLTEIMDDFKRKSTVF